MSDDGMSPIPDSPQRNEGGHYRADDDIELPPMPDGESTSTDSPGWQTARGGEPKRIGISSILGTAAVIGALLVGGWYVTQGGSAEKQHPNWQHVAAAAKASDGVTNQLTHLDKAGNTQVLPTIQVTAADADRAATHQVRLALRRNDPITATAALHSAQRMPTASQNPDVQPPTITADSELAAELKDGRRELFQIELFDCCHEDGDIVEVVVNGRSFATVPIMHNGTMLSIPLTRGSNTVTIRGVKDGGGGVTLSFRTSRGDYFARSMRVGEEYQMGVVVQ